MPTRKKTTASSKSSRAKKEPLRAERVSTHSTHVDEISYETKLTIVVLLLLFVYPLGLIFMWFWMKNWPLWLKLLISLPIVVAALGILFGIFAISLILRHVATDKNFQYQMRQYQQYHLSPAPSITITPPDTTTPTTSDSNSSTY